MERTLSPKRAALPTGIVTFLFADIEGSTKLAHGLSQADWAALLAQHDALVDATVTDHRGVVVKHEGDGTFAAFSDALAGAAAAVAISRGMADRAWPGEARPRLRMGLHAATAQLTADKADYLGLDVHYAARLTGAANGGQILLSESAFEGLGGSVPEGATIQSVGRRRVRDFDQPLPMHRLIVAGAADDDRSLRTIAESDLPEALTTFVGREREVAAVSDLLQRSRMVTLTGPGGAGKTRLAVSVAAHVRDRFRDGVTFVELAPIRDVALVRGVIATAVGVAEVPGRSITDVLRDHLADHQQLLVLDNLEQLLPDGAGIAGELVRGAPQLAVLASSREPLRVAGEQEYPVPPLAESDARALFMERARLVRPNLELSAADAAAVEQIVDQLAGLPLAIELAAARIRLFAPSAILERLGRSLDLLSGGGARDLPARQQTLRATLAWSHDLLTPAEQVIFRRLAVLADEWSPEVAQAIADPERALEIDVLDGLASLVDKSLLRVIDAPGGEVRFARHAFVREFAQERLEASGERAELERRHAEYFGEQVRQWGPHLADAGAERYMRRMDGAIHDLRQAMTWSLGPGDPDVGMRIIGAGWRWFQIRMQLREGLDWAARLLATDRRTDPSARLAALAGQGSLGYWSMDYLLTRRAYEERLAIAETLGEPRALAEAHYDMAFVGMVEKDLDLLRRESELALAMFEALGDRTSTIRVRQAAVLAHVLSGDYATARVMEEQNLADFRATQAWFRAADSMLLLGAIHRGAGDPAAGLASVREGLRQLNGRVGGTTLGALGTVAVLLAESGGEAEADRAARLAGAIGAAQAETGEAIPSVSVLHLPEPGDAARKRLGSERAEALMAEGAKLSIEQAMELALVE
ncbi:MAG TPA: adenylate/guanylate cyclase domain-containing protein [Candidatus Limnocylindrales bacterium]